MWTKTLWRISRVLDSTWSNLSFRTEKLNTPNLHRLWRRDFDLSKTLFQLHSISLLRILELCCQSSMRTHLGLFWFSKDNRWSQGKAVSISGTSMSSQEHKSVKCTSQIRYHWVPQLFLTPRVTRLPHMSQNFNQNLINWTRKPNKLDSRGQGFRRI